jgi:glucose dehydrogenase
VLRRLRVLSEWRYSSGDNGSRKYSALAQITKDNVVQLRVVWRRPQAYWSQGDDRRILTFRNQYLYALDARTGEPVAGFGVQGRVDLTVATGAAKAYAWNGTPLVVRDVAIGGQNHPAEFVAFALTEAPSSTRSSQ